MVYKFPRTMEELRKHRKNFGGRVDGNSAYLPTKEEIEKATAEIRAGWDQAMYEKRAVQSTVHVEWLYTTASIVPHYRRHLDGC